MKTKKVSGAMAVPELLIVVPIIAAILAVFASCADNESRKEAKNIISQVPSTSDLSVMQTSQPPTADYTDENEPIFISAEVPASYPGGESELFKFITDNILYPESAIKNNIQGIVFLNFCITKNGNVEKISILRGADPALDNEAVRVISELPDWIPAKQDGEPVNVWMTLPISFKLTE